MRKSLLCLSFLVLLMDARLVRGADEKQASEKAMRQGTYDKNAGQATSRQTAEKGAGATRARAVESRGLVPLSTLGKQMYQGYMGGLYAEGRNEPWGAHADALRRIQATIGPLDNNGKAETVKALAAAGPDGRKYVYLLNSGPAVALGALVVDGQPLPMDLRVSVESVFTESVAVGLAFGAKTFTEGKALGDLELGPWSLTLLMLPPRGSAKP